MGNDDQTSYVKLADEPVEEPEDKKPWCRLLTLLISCALLAGLTPGQAVWLQLFAQVGIFGHTCDPPSQAGTPCVQQYLAMGAIFTFARNLSGIGILTGGLLFDTFGGRRTGLLGGFMVMGGFLVLLLVVIGAENGLDSTTSYLLLPVVVILDFGSIFSSQGVYSILFHFADVGGIVFAWFGATMDFACLLPVVLEVIMAMYGLSVVQGVLCWTALMAFAFFTFWLSCPTHEEYEAQAEKVLGQKLSKRKGSVITVMKDATRTLWQDMASHVMFMSWITISPLWIMLYLLNAGVYGAFLFHGDPTAGTKLANIISLGGAAVGIFIVPIITYIGEQIGSMFMYGVCFTAHFLGFIAVGQANWWCQSVVIIGMFTALGSGGVINGNRCLAYAPPSKIGTFIGMISLFLSLAQLPSQLLAQYLFLTSPVPLAETLTGVSVAGLVSTGLEIGRYLWFGLPKSPTLLPEEIQEICMAYACKNFKDIAFVLHMEAETDLSDFASRLSTNDQEVHARLMISIDSSRLAQKMNELGADDLARLMVAGFSWRRDLAQLDLTHSMFGMAGGSVLMKNLLRRVGDISNFGKGAAKTVDQFEKELAKGRSRLIEGSDGSLQRIVNIVAVRLFNNVTSPKLTLLQMRESFADGRIREKIQLPGTKMGPDDTIEQCVESIRTKAGISDIGANFSYSDVEVFTTKLESPSYPGVFTVYNKKIVNGHVNETDIVKLERIGFQSKPFETKNEATSMTYFFEWVEEERAASLLKEQDEKPSDEKAQEKNGREADEPAPKLRTASELLWSLQVREYTKKLLFLLEMQDSAMLEKWLLTEKVENLQSAMTDLATWPHFDPEKVLMKFHKILPEDQLSVLLTRRSELKPFIIDLLIGDLAAAVRGLRKNATGPFCKNGHPLWPACGKASPECSACGKSMATQSSSFFKCYQCKQDVCSECVTNGLCEPTV